MRRGRPIGAVEAYNEGEPSIKFAQKAEGSKNSAWIRPQPLEKSRFAEGKCFDFLPLDLDWLPFFLGFVSLLLGKISPPDFRSTASWAAAQPRCFAKNSSVRVHASAALGAS